MTEIAINDDKTLLDIGKIHQFLTTESTWAKGISLNTVKRSIAHSVCIGAYADNQQVGFCRIITDQATFANLVDVIVWPEYRGQGIAAKLMTAVLQHSSVADVRRFTLATSDAHGLYAKFGFAALTKPDTFMQIYRPDVYAS
ncbi:MAG: GNAT family N-acetyltransferase [Gammaproteobacteria bacterium]|nr:GNAT family N-acetyltransferase [Gammaproteobacteria bacterium]MBU1556294.1 GNAT family N-acetyltransferase [Gammaproteobacteria bacterium]MBU2068886.1 GNAT family N-acetyltransferase [Gammaproteobacteria bacterium]MBU2184951.1 GNAT family N-acetyltransferase [Gammaproteobacteria bacterium]MBU2204218.1 GNAT family N-acetyltransferase [Gammaproteobacteria bacterium]